MSKITYEQKIELLERYKKRPQSVNDPEVITAITTDVIKASLKGGRRVPEQGPEEHPDNTLYNKSMGVYREFLKGRDSHLDLSGKKAPQYKEAMLSIIEYIRKFARSNGKPHDDAAVFNGIRFLFGNWDRLNDFHKNRLTLPDIYAKIEEILPMIKNGYDKKSSDKATLDTFEQSIKAKR
jgi:hypothetical protein